MRREKTAGAAKRRMAFQYAAGGMPDDRGPSPVCFGGGNMRSVTGKSRENFKLLF